MGAADQAMRASTEFDAITPELWSAAFYPTLLESLPFNGSVARDYEGEIKALGDTVRIPNVPQFDLADEILENESASADSVTVTTQSLVINKQLVKDYIITKRAAAQSIDAGNQLRDLAMHSILKKMQLIIIAEIAPSSSAPDHTLAYGSGTTLALADILAAKELLDASDVEESGRTLICGAAQQNDMFNITGFVSRDFIPGGSPLTEGAIRTPVMGFNFKWTSEVGNTSYFFHPIFLQMAVQQLPEVTVHDLGSDGTRAKRVNVDVLFGVKQCSNLRVVTVA
jgi:hypothetical protein